MSAGPAAGDRAGDGTDSTGAPAGAPALRTNWAGNVTYRAAGIVQPTTLEQVRAAVAGARKIRAVGSGHSFNDLGDSEHQLMSLAALEPAFSIDTAAAGATVSVSGGVRYGELARYLHQHGYALHNLASLPHISVAGAVATGTHGSGDGNANLAAAVSDLDLVTADGATLTLRRGDPDFAGAVISLGALGIVTRLRLNIVPDFRIRTHVFEAPDWETALAHFDEITAAAYSVSLFTDWCGDRLTQIWFKSRVTDDETAAAVATVELPGFPGAHAASEERHPVWGASAENCSPQRGVAGPWHERLPHFRSGFTPSSGAELQSEYLLPREHAAAALEALRGLSTRLAPLLLVCEIRTIAADELWLSPAYRQACIGIHFTWRPDQAAVEALLPRIEQTLALCDARPHWGKLFAGGAPEMERLYARLPDFRRLAGRLDPEVKFGNAYLDRVIFGYGLPYG